MSFKMKLLLLLSLLIGGATSLLAQTALIVHQKSGEVVYYSFSEQPKVTYSGTDLVLTTSKTKVEYPLANLLKFTFGDMANGVEDVMESKAEVKLGNGAIALTGAKPSSVVSIYNASGMLINSQTVDENGNAYLSSSNLAEGIYIIKSDNVTFKFMKK